MNDNLITENSQYKQNDSYRFTVGIVVLAVLASGSIVNMAVAPLLPLLMQEYGIGKGEVSWIASAAPIITAITVIPAGILAAKIGARKTFAMGTFLQSVGILTPFCSNFGLLVLTRCCFALGQAMTVPVSGGIVAEWFESKEMPLVNACNVAAYGVGSTLALFITVPLAAAFSWRAPLTIYGGVNLIAASVWLVLGRERRKGVSSTRQGVPFSMAKIRGILRLKTTWLIAGCMFGSHVVLLALNSWLPTYYYTVFNIPLARASSILAIRSLIGIPTPILIGIISMRLGLRKPFLIIPGLLIGLVGAGTFLTDNMVVILISVALLGICFASISPILYTITMEQPGATPEMVPVVLAVAQVTSNIASFISPPLVGYLTDYTGSYLPGFIICCVLSGSLFICAKYLPETGPKARRVSIVS